MDEGWVKMDERFQCKIGNHSAISSEESVGYNSIMVLGKFVFLFVASGYNLSSK